MTDQPHILAEQIAYYRARAGEYDEWFFRRGRYDRGPDHRSEWFSEIGALRSALRAAALSGPVLELAAGTGLWTERLLGPDRHVFAVDSSVLTLATNRRRTARSGVSHVAADIFALPFTTRFESVFFSFWLSHVPPERFEAFWEIVERCVTPTGRVFVIDSLREPASTAVDHPPVDDSGIAIRRLNDGREFRIVKVFYDPASLEHRLGDLGWSGRAHSTGRFFFYGFFARGAR